MTSNRAALEQGFCNLLNSVDSSELKELNGRKGIFCGQGVTNVDLHLAELSRPYCTKSVNLALDSSLTDHIASGPTIRIENDVDSQRFFLSGPRLPQGHIALPEKPFKNATRRGLHPADLDRERWCDSLREIQPMALIERFQTDPCDFIYYVDDLAEIDCGTVLAPEDESREYKFPEETSSFNEGWARKEISECFMRLLNGSNGGEVKLYLGVTKNGQAIGAPLMDIRQEFSDLQLRVFPPLPKESIRVRVMKIVFPSTISFTHIEWYSSLREAWGKVIELRGLGWIVEPIKEERYGVMMQKPLNTDHSAAFVDGQNPFEAMTDRFIIELTSRPQFQQAYINRDVYLTQPLGLKALGAWLRLRTTLARPFAARLQSTRCIPLKIGKCPPSIPCRYQILDSKDLAHVKDIILQNSVLDIVAMVNIAQLKFLLELESDDWNGSRIWTVALVVRLDVKEEAIVNALEKLPDRVKVLEIIHEDMSLDPDEQPSQYRDLERRGGFDIVSLNLGPKDLENLTVAAKAFIFPEDQTSAFPLWGVVKHYIVETDLVKSIVASVEDMLKQAMLSENIQERLVIARQGAKVGLTSTLAKAAQVLSSSNQVFFVHEPGPSLDSLESILRRGKPSVVFADRDFPEDILMRFRLPKVIIVVGSSTDDHLVEHRVTLKWSKHELLAFGTILKELPFTEDKRRVETALDLALAKTNSDELCPFYMLPLIAARGIYRPVRDWIKEQNTQVQRFPGLADNLNTLALMSITVQDELMRKIIEFSEFSDPQRFPLLRVIGQAVSFAHPELAKLHLHMMARFYEGCWQQFPSNILDVWKNAQGLLSRIVFRDKILGNKILHQIIFERTKNSASEEMRSFSTMTAFVFENAEHEEYLNSAEMVILVSGISMVDLLTLRSRLSRKMAERERSISFANAELDMVQG